MVGWKNGPVYQFPNLPIYQSTNSPIYQYLPPYPIESDKLMRLFPAVVIGGPPDVGKSVLTYNLSQRLRERGAQHYVLRAAPDGQGDWTSQADQSLVRTILVPKKWTPAFVEGVCRDLARRHLPLIVDAGGRPADWQEAIFDQCTHAVLLTAAKQTQGDEATHRFWLDLFTRHNLLLLADLRSDLNGASRVTARHPLLKGVIAGLEHGQPAGGPTFEALVERITHLFAYDAEDLRRAHLTSAPVETVVDLDRLARSLGVPFVAEKATWTPGQLPELLDYLPASTPLGLYGRGPNWLYAALALYTYPAQLYQFDVRLGWVTPPSLVITSAAPSPLITARILDRPTHARLELAIVRDYLDYREAEGLALPPLPPGKGVVLSGKLPLWLWTALAQAYRHTPWIAVFQPQLEDQAVVIASQQEDLPIGGLVTSEA
jgi:CRISPR-associated protein Csx3